MSAQRGVQNGQYRDKYPELRAFLYLRLCAIARGDEESITDLDFIVDLLASVRTEPEA
jgi:hypothetical protein